MVRTLFRSGQLCTSLLTRRSACVVFVLVGGTILSFAGYRYVHRMERRAVQETIDSRAREQAVLVRTTVLRSLESLQATAALFQTNHEVHRADFHAFVTSALAHHPELQALGFSPRVAQADRSAFEAAARNDGLTDYYLHDLSPDGQLIPSSQRAEYFPVRFIEPEATNRRAIGFSIDCSPVRAESLQEARDTGAVTATPPLRLVQEPADGLGFLALQAVYSVNPANNRSPRSLLGYASAVFRYEDLLGPALGTLAKQGFNVKVVDNATKGTIFSSGKARTPTDISAGYLTDGNATIDVAGCRWLLELQPTESFIDSHLTDQARVIFAGGISLTLLLAGYLYRGLRHLAEVEERVTKRTAELSQEITERKRAEATAREAETAARRAERNFRSIVENSVEGIFQTSSDGRYISANRALARIYGFDSPDHLMQAVGNIAGQLYIAPFRRDEFIRLIQRDGEVSNFESQIFKRDGSIIWISENARVVRDETNTVTCYEGTVVDITARKFAEQALRDARDELEQRVETRTLELACSNAALQVEVAERKRAEETAANASRAKSEFLANMSHEIRTPMNAILGYAQLVHRDRSLPPEHAESISTILSSGRHLMSLIDDILDLSKIEAGHTEVHTGEFDLCALVRDIAGMFRHRCQQKSLELILDLPSESDCSKAHAVRGDQQKLTQVLINLMGNAVKFTDAGHVAVCVAKSGEMYSFHVRDSGIGIPTAAIRDIFEPFQQAHGETRGGSGLGLAIAARHVQLMGGELRCNSAEGIGSTFNFKLSLPAISKSRSESNSISMMLGDVRIARGQQISALVVDDVLENRKFLGSVLLAAGCEVHTCASGVEALELVERFSPQIAFIDMMMPGMDGHQTAKHLVARYGDAAPRLVATTAAALTHEQQQLRAEGFADVLIKPLLIERIYLSMSTLLGVTFETTDSATTRGDDASGHDVDGVGFPSDLRAQLREAAQRYSITDIRRVISEIDQLGPDYQLVVTRLKDLMRRYDLQGVARFAATLKEGEVAVGIGSPA